MKRDMELVRTLLLEAENQPVDAPRGGVTTVDGYSDATVARHLELLEEAGYVEANILRIESHGAVQGELLRITSDGYDFLETIRSPGAWARVKELIAKESGGATLALVKAIATNYLEQKFGQQ